MAINRGWAFAVLLGAGSLAMPGAALAGTPFSLPLIPAEWRNPERPVSVRVELNQVEIHVAIKPVPGEGGSGGDLFDALVSGAFKAARNKSATVLADGIRDSLDGFDADGVLMAGVQPELARAGWLKLLGQRPERIDSYDVHAQVQSEVPDMRLLVMAFNYGLSPDLDAVEVSYSLQLAPAPKPGKKPNGYSDWYGGTPYWTFGRVVTKFEGLPVDLEARSKALMAENGSLLRTALTDGLTKAAQFAVRTVQIDAAQDAALSDKARQRVAIGDFSKVLILEGADNLVAPPSAAGKGPARVSLKPDNPGLVLWAGSYSSIRAVTVKAP